MNDPEWIPSPMGCPYCGQGTMSVREPGNFPAITEPVVCPHCHGVCIESLGRLRAPNASELADIDGAEYARCCRELVERFGPPKYREYRLRRAAEGSAIRDGVRDGLTKPH
jgi:hypothetical protein